MRGDQSGGRACVIPLTLFVRLAADASISFNEVSVSIAAKEVKPCGRLVVEATRGGLNSDDKKALLARRWTRKHGTAASQCAWTTPLYPTLLSYVFRLLAR